MTGKHLLRRHRGVSARLARHYLWAIRSRIFCAFARLRGPNAKRKFLILDPALVGYQGHHAEYSHLLRGGLGSQFDVRIYCNLKAKTGLIMHLRAQPVFYDTNYLASDAPEFNLMYRARTRSLTAGLKRIDPRVLDPTTVAVIHTATPTFLDAVAEWFTALPVDRRPRLFMLFQFPPDFGLPTGFDRRPVRTRAREAAAALVAQGAVHFASLSRSLAKLWTDELGQQCDLMPIPVRWPDLSRSLASPERLTFGFFGGLRLVKGARVLSRAIPEFLKRNPDAHFIVHAPPEESDEEAVRLLQGIPQVELVTTTFASKQTYFSQFLRAGCILIPYDPAAYAVRMSGVFVEALGMGRLIVTTKGTSMAEALQSWPRSAAIVAESYTVESVLQGLDMAYSALLEREKSGAAMVDAETIRAYSPDAFCSKLVALMHN